MTVTNPTWKVDIDPEDRRGNSTVAALQRLGTVMAVMTIAFGGLFIGSNSMFIKPKTPPDEWWLSLTFGGVEVWDVVFPLAGAMLFICVSKMKHVRTAHILTGSVWVALGLVWSIGGIIHSPSPFFGVGIVALFVGTIHALLAQIYFFEGVE